MMLSSSIPTVSVWMVTYNHEHYIEKAIESIMMQETQFPFKLLIGEDCSTDRTRSICQELKAKYSLKIELFLHKNNLGPSANGLFMYEQCFQSNAKYIALLEGDDYWTDPLKLQKQVDFLEANPSFALCFHRAEVLYPDKNRHLHPLPLITDNGVFEYKDLLQYHNFITTASVVFRKPDNFTFPDWFTHIPYGDLGLYKLILGDQKRIGLIDEVMSVYRVNGEGIYSKLSKQQKLEQHLKFYDTIAPFLTEVEREIVKKKRDRKIRELVKLKYSKNRLLNFFYNKYLNNKY